MLRPLPVPVLLDGQRGRGRDRGRRGRWRGGRQGRVRGQGGGGQGSDGGGGLQGGGLPTLIHGADDEGHDAHDEKHQKKRPGAQHHEPTAAQLLLPYGGGPLPGGPSSRFLSIQFHAASIQGFSFFDKNEGRFCRFFLFGEEEKSGAKKRSLRRDMAIRTTDTYLFIF